MRHARMSLVSVRCVRRSCALAVLLAGAVGCEGRNTLPSPTLRVDLRDRLPTEVLRRLAAADTTYACSRTIELAAQGASQKFELSWRVFRFKEDLHITAVQVEPVGSTQGATDPTASATAEPTRINKGDEGAQIAVVPIRITWSATSGCATLGDRRTVALRADTPGCKPPQNKLKLFGSEPEKPKGTEPQPGSGTEERAEPGEAPEAE